MDSCTPLTHLPGSLEDFRVRSLPSSAFYITDFITQEEEQALLNKIELAPKPRWKKLSNRRLQTWPSDLNKNTLLESSLPSWLMEPILSRLLSIPVLVASKQTHVFKDSPHGAPNHVLINEYLPGQGIMPHKDGAAYYPVVCTVSLGASLCLDIHGSKEGGIIESEPRWRIFQEPRSLLVTTGELYTNYLHGISEVKEDVNLGPTTISNWDLLRAPNNIVNGKSERHTRTSITYRDVIKVSNLGAKFAMFSKR